MAEQVVRVYADAEADLERRGGAWAALLTFGEHRRAECDTDPTATLDRLLLLAVVHALERLTRPVTVGVTASSPYLRQGVTGPKRTSDDNYDLWQRLDSASATHAVTWTWIEDGAGDPCSELAEVRRSAIRALLKAKSAPPSIGSVAEDFLADRSGRVSSRTAAKYEGVVWTLRAAVGWYEDKRLEEIPASEVTDQLHHFFEFLIHKEFPDVGELKGVKTALLALVEWFAERGHLDASTAATEREELKEKLDEYIRLRQFLVALQDFVRSTGANMRAGSAEGEITDEYLRIIGVTDDSITFAEWDPEGKEIGPIAVPPEVAKLAHPGWEILLTAVLVDDEWLLSNVANGEI